MHLSLSSHVSARAQWLGACGTRPEFKPWESLNGEKQKFAMLHALAPETRNRCEMLWENAESVEPVLRSVRSIRSIRSIRSSDKTSTGRAEDDPNGWVVATRRSKSRSGNLPLVLWLLEEQVVLPNSIALVEGEVHFVPPIEQRAELARKWLFLRATYDGLPPPSDAQCASAADIVALAKLAPIQAEHWRVNAAHRARYGWANPLYEEDANSWYNSREWRRNIFRKVGFV